MHKDKKANGEMENWEGLPPRKFKKKKKKKKS